MRDGFLHDVRYAQRLLWVNPGFAAFALLSLVLGIGAKLWDGVPVRFCSG